MADTFVRHGVGVPSQHGDLPLQVTGTVLPIMGKINGSAVNGHFLGYNWLILVTRRVSASSVPIDCPPSRAECTRPGFPLAARGTRRVSASCVPIGWLQHRPRLQ
ncbi:hypothetical protein NDU88_000086 [Pleurodeles waltl]|uniref:Uncharacterized protein n=1 Tax=Pleurodeles waltl TaxID=8319 RepID=A0AAV7KNM1_PLEWA|nr:hypothetical protein NDU88_000086 [Pleurodeles waltl]